MAFDPEKHHRRSLRLPGYDYAQAGAYFVTIVTQGRECLFGDVVDGQMCLNDAGRMVERWWYELNRKSPDVTPDTYVVMPNHFHGVLLVGADLCVRPAAVDANAAVMCPPDPGAHADVPPPGPSPGAHIGAPLHAGISPQTPPGAHTGAQSDVPPPCPPPGAHIGAPLHAGIFPQTPPGARAGAPLRGIVQWFKTMTTNDYIRAVKTAGWPPFRLRLWQRNYYEHIIRDDASCNRIRQYVLDNPGQWAFDRENLAATPSQLPTETWRV